MEDSSNKIAVELVTPDRLVYSNYAEMVVVPGSEGDFGVLYGHSPMISSVRMGIIDIHEDKSQIQRIFILGGFAEVTGDRCNILVEKAIDIDKMSREQAEQNLKKAQDALAVSFQEEEKPELQKEVEVAQALLQML